jgi:pSer/pThr/pTyr-binding forkhead associated (FHA) protein
MAVMVRLLFSDGEGNTRNFEFEQKKVVIGRDPSADVVIEDVEISRKHLVISQEKDGFSAEDQGSTNGTFLGGKRLSKKTMIKSGDVLRLGEAHTVEVVIQQPAEVETEPEAEEVPVAAIVEPAKLDQPKPEAMPTTKAEASPPAKPLPRQKKGKSGTLKKQHPTWIVILLAALAFLVIFCVIPLIVVEVTNQWCDLFAGFFNSMSPGVCP